MSIPTPSRHEYGVSFSPFYATNLGLDWKKVYIEMFTDLKVKKVRIPTYWNISESADDYYDFSDVDFMLDQASKHNAEVVLVIGEKQPRWPECFRPNWVMSLNTKERQEKLLEYIKETITRYKNRPEIKYYQLENEPLVRFGTPCDSQDRAFLSKEINFVKSLDSKKPIIMTDAGEAGPPISIMSMTDIYGSTLYRTVYNPIWGYFYYPYPAQFYTLKSAITNLLTSNNKDTFIMELQTEPWSPTTLQDTPIDDQTAVFSIEDFESNIEYAKRTKFNTIYLWGVEWWYFIKNQNHPEYWDFARKIFL